MMKDEILLKMHLNTFDSLLIMMKEVDLIIPKDQNATIVLCSLSTVYGGF